MSRGAAVTITVDRADDHLVVRWTAGQATGSCRFDHLPGTTPEWLGSGDDLLEGADRRSEKRVLDAVATWATEAGLELGVWFDDAGIELLA